MRYARGSGIFYLLIASSFVLLLLLAPFPHYSPGLKAWFLGESIGSKMIGTGSGQKDGVPLYKVASEIARASIASPLDISCTSDSDCMEYKVTNQCKIFCGNGSSENNVAVAQLDVRRICDPKMWKTPALDCKCLANKCISLE